MKLFYAPDIATSLSLPVEEAAHALRVLRLTEGDEIAVTDGEGRLFDCRIMTANKSGITLDILREIANPHERRRHIHVAIAPTKNKERMEWFVEKATELGISEITLLHCQHSERPVYNPERLHKVVIAAMKQSGKTHRPRINALMSFSAFMREATGGCRYIAHVREGEERQELHKLLAQQTEYRHTILIGPEGDFSQPEVDEALSRGYVPVSMGDAVLRTETAALTATVLLNLL